MDDKRHVTPGPRRFPAVLSCWVLAGALAGCGIGRDAPGLQIPDDAAESIDGIVNTLYENGQFSGAVLVAVNGEVRYRKGVGYANLELRVPNTPDTRFRIASFTKPITAMLILQLVEDEVIRLDGRLTEYLPAFDVDGGESITIHQLLTHTAGITGESRIPDLADVEKRHYSRDQLLDYIRSHALVFAPGKGREYSNFGYALLALVIEKVTGRSYDDVLQERVCRPAGMVDTRSEVTSRPVERLASGYVHDYFAGLQPAPFLDMSFCLGAGQLLSTVEDLHRFDQALYSDTLLSAPSKQLFFSTYGWLPVRYPFGKGSRRVQSNNLEGSINGFQSHTQRVADDRVFLVALRNVKEAVYENQIVIKWPSAIASPILSVLYGEAYDMPRMSGAFTVFRALTSSGRDEADRVYRDIAGTSSRGYYFDTREFDFFETQLQARGMAARARALGALRQRHFGR